VGARHGSDAKLLSTAAPRDSDGEAGRSSVPLEATTMIEQAPLSAEPTTTHHRDERSMRVMEYAMAILALVAALLLSFR
jgi:hypothetical protein